MKRIYKIRISGLLVLHLLVTPIYAQLSPFTIPPKWYFGQQAGLDFSSGSPVYLAGGQTNGWGQEGSSTICDPSGNVVFYTDNYRLYDALHNQIQFLNGGTSSTQGAVCVPDPASPSNTFYLLTANVGPGGEKPAANADLGLYYYRIQKLGASITVLSWGKLADYDKVSEMITAGSDLNGNYWVVTHEGGDWAGWNMRNIYAWKITSTGIQPRVQSTIAGITGNNAFLGSMKINKCQTRLAVVSDVSPSTPANMSTVEIFSWDASTGQVTGLITRITGYYDLYGGEFSPDGNMFYFTSLTGNMLYQLNISTNTVYTDPTWTSSNNKTEMGTMQLGPDDKIYVTNVSDFSIANPNPCYIGVINNPNVAGAGCNYNKTGFILNPSFGIYGMPNIFRGISNLGWMNPNSPTISNSNCPVVTFGYSFTTYFNNNIPVDNSTIEWDFDEGAGFVSGLGATPTHSYSNSGSYNVKIRFKDQTCGITWNANKDISNCTLPVTWVNIEANPYAAGILVSWITADEIDNQHFIIERSSDGKNFSAIGKVTAGQGKTGNYEFYDEAPLNGENYYRVTQVDFNGNSTQSPVARANHKIFSNAYLASPSDIKSESTTTSKIQMIIIHDVLGKELYKTTNSEELNFDFAQGVYIITVITEEGTYSQKIFQE